MSYIPELRDALLKAAERQAEQARAPRRGPRWQAAGRPLRGSMLALGSVAAIAVAGLVLAGHRAPPQASGGAVTSAGSVPSRAALRRAADAAAVSVWLPAGTRPWDYAHGNPPAFDSGNGAPSIPHAVLVRRYLRTRGDIQTLMSEISVHTPSAGGSSSGYATSSSGPGGTSSAGGTIGLTPEGRIVREVEVDLRRTRDGAIAARVIGVAGYYDLLPAWAVIPGAVTRIDVHVAGQVHTLHSGTVKRHVVITAPARVRAVVGLMNGLTQGATRSPQCPARGGETLRLTLFSGSKPVARAISSLECGEWTLSVGGRTLNHLQWDGDHTPAGLIRTLEVLGYLSGASDKRIAATVRQAGLVFGARPLKGSGPLSGREPPVQHRSSNTGAATTSAP